MMNKVETLREIERHIHDRIKGHKSAKAGSDKSHERRKLIVRLDEANAILSIVQKLKIEEELNA